MVHKAVAEDLPAAMAATQEAAAAAHAVAQPHVLQLQFRAGLFGPKMDGETAVGLSNRLYFQINFSGVFRTTGFRYH